MGPLYEKTEHKLTLSEIDKRRDKHICEMAFSRNEFKIYLMTVTTTIISYFALIKYATLTNTHQQTVTHWKRELKDKIMNFQEIDTKPKHNDRDLVYQTLMKTWTSKMELDTHSEYIIRRFSSKFEEEGINIDEKMKQTLANSFVSQIPNIINEMAFGTKDSTNKYMDSI